MLDTNIVKQIKKAPVEERLELIELLLQSLKNDLKAVDPLEKPSYKQFKIRKFSLGEEVTVDRDELYSERG